MLNSPELNNAFTSFKEKLAKQLLAGFTLLCLIGLPLSLSRWFEIGFQLIFVHHILITLATVVCYLNRHRTSYKLDLSVIAISLGSMIISGVITFGMQSGVVTFVPVVCILVALMTNFWSAIIVTALWTAFILFIGYFYIYGLMDFQVAPEIYANNMGAWYIMAIGSLISISILLIVAKQGLTNLIGLLEQVQNQKKEISFLADHDFMTGYKVARLATPLMEQHLASAERNGSKVAIVFVDLNNFKTINDTYGHSVGDELLTNTAEKFKHSLREVDSTIRVGGDEFLYILPEIERKEDIDTILQRMIESIDQIAVRSGLKVSVEASIGVAIFPDDAKQPSRLRYMADIAMYAAKQGNIKIPVYYSELKKNRHEEAKKID